MQARITGWTLIELMVALLIVTAVVDKIVVTTLTDQFTVAAFPWVRAGIHLAANLLVGWLER